MIKWIIVIFALMLSVFAKDNFNEKLDTVIIRTSIDGSEQKSTIYYATNKNRPLIVSLHPWGGDYYGKDMLSEFAKKNDINYIYPGFRGANRNKDACCSNLALQDIDDSISHMINTNNISISDITIVGVSGGGYATLCSYFKTKHKIKQFISFAAITNLEDWYYEMKKRGATYASDIMNCTSSKKVLNMEEIEKRSPVYFSINKDTFNNSKLYLLHGIHDGFTGSVPITHSIDMYNVIVIKDGEEKEV